MPYQLGTVQAGKMPSSEANMTFFVDLSKLVRAGNDIFDTCLSDGGDIRIYSSDGLTQFPRDIINFNKADKTGWLAFKADVLDVGTSVRIAYDGDSTEPDAYSTYGSENAWDSSYNAAYHTADYANRTILDATSNSLDMSVDHRYWTYKYTNISGTGPNAHQGCCYDGDNYFFIGTNYLYKRATIIGPNSATNADPCGDVDENCNHLGAGCCHDNYLYVPVEQYSSCAGFSYQYIARYNKYDLSFYDKHDVSAQGHEVSALTIDQYAGAHGVIYVVSYCDGSKIWKYDLSDFSYLGYITISSTRSNIQGICLDPDSCGFIISIERGYLQRIEPDGSYVGGVGLFYNNEPSSPQSVYTYNNNLYWWCGTEYKLRTLTNIRNLEGPIGGCLFFGDAEENGVKPWTTYGWNHTSLTYTMPDVGAVSFIIQPRAYFNYNTIFDNSSDPNDWEGWMYSDGRIAARVDTALSYDLDNLHTPDGDDENYFCHFAWTKDGANVDQALIVDGSIRASNTYTWVAPGSTFYMNGGNAGNNIGASYYWFFALRNIDVSQDIDRVTTEYNNQSDPSSFWGWSDEYDSISLHDFELDIASYYQSETDLCIDVASYFQTTNFLSMDVSANGFIVINNKLDISSANIFFEDIRFNAQAAMEQLENIFLHITVSDGVVKGNVAMDISVGDGDKKESFGLDILAVTSRPEFRYVYAMNLSSVIKEIAE